MSDEPPVAIIGRPREFTEEAGARVIDAVAAGRLLWQVVDTEGMPSHTTLYRWQEQFPAFRDALARARTAGAHRLAAECVALTDNVDPEGSSGSARVSKAREQVGVRKWLAGCLDRDTYGERPPVVAVQVTPVVAVAFGRLGGGAPGE